MVKYLNISKSQGVWLVATTTTMRSIGMPIGGMLHRKFGYLVPMILGVLINW